MLTANGVTFQYEPLMLIAGHQFRPDFFLPAQSLFIEICGYNHMPFYRDRTAHKKRLYELNDMQAAFVHFDGKGSLIELLIDELAKHGLPLQNLTGKKKPGLSSAAKNDPGFTD